MRTRDSESTLMPNAIRALLVDLDGTLVDSVPDLADAVNEMMAGLGLPAQSDSQVQSWVGAGAERLVERALRAGAGEAAARIDFSRAYSVFVDAYGRRVCVRSKLYPGVEEGLGFLQAGGYRLGCVTNKPRHLAESLLRELGVSGYFSVVVGGDSLPQKKPDPAILRYAAARLDTPLKACMMLGDSVLDVQAARAAGIGVVCVTYGYNQGKDIRHCGPDGLIDSLEELRFLLPPVCRDSMSDDSQ